MKKFLRSVAVAATMVVGMTSFAQESGAGVKGGLNYTFWSPDVEGAEGVSGFGFNIGGFYNYMASEKFGIQGELVYSNEGYSEDESGVSSSLTINFLDINVVPKYYVTEGLSLQGVLGFGLAMSAKVKQESNGQEFEGDAEVDSAVLFGLGAGYELESGLGFNLRWINRLYSDVSYNTLNLGATYKF